MPGVPIFIRSVSAGSELQEVPVRERRSGASSGNSESTPSILRILLDDLV